MEIMTQKQESPREKMAGFSLIFVAILLTVAALVFVSVLPGQEAGDTNQKTLNNAKKLERVEEAMRAFMAANGRRPCPADGQYDQNTQYFGIEADNPGSCVGGGGANGIIAPLGPDTSTSNCINSTTEGAQAAPLAAQSRPRRWGCPTIMLMTSMAAVLAISWT